MGRFLSADPFWGYAQQPQTQHRYVYAGNDPVNRVDPSGLKCRPPTAADGIAIHRMIQNDYRNSWDGPGRIVVAPYAIEGASKEGLRFQWPEGVGKGVPEVKGDPTWSFGYVDIAVLVSPPGVPNELYEIKSIYSWVQGAGEVWWYLYHMKLTDPNWVLGTNYNSARPIGPWPGEPDAEVWAGLKMPGLIVYWCKEKPECEKEPERVPEQVPWRPPFFIPFLPEFKLKLPTLDPSLWPGGLYGGRGGHYEPGWQ